MDSNYTHDERVEEMRICDMHIHRLNDEIRGFQSLISQVNDKVAEYRNQARQLQIEMLEVVDQRSHYIRRKDKVEHG